MSDDPAKPPVRDIERDVGKLGVMVNHLLYDAPDLRVTHDGRSRLRVRVLVDPADVGTVVAVLPDGTRKRLNAVHAAYAKGLGLDEHLSNLRAARGARRRVAGDAASGHGGHRARPPGTSDRVGRRQRGKGAVVSGRPRCLDDGPLRSRDGVRRPVDVMCGVAGGAHTRALLKVVMAPRTRRIADFAISLPPDGDATVA